MPVTSTSPPRTTISVAVRSSLNAAQVGSTGSLASVDLDAARAQLAVIESLQRKLDDATLPYWREEVQVQFDAVRAWIAYGEGKTEAAADREDAVDKDPVTPGEVLPARELYANMLLTTKNYPEALKQYRRVLENAPNRLNALIGAVQAAEGAGAGAAAAQFKAQSERQAAFGNRARARLNRPAGEQ